jgi:putative transcriptional regulator
MYGISHIRAKLGVTQQALAVALKVSQGNVSHYERGQNVPPEVAKRLISFASGRGLVLSFDDIYGAPATLPHRRATDPTPAATTNPTGETA